ncbi:hypothetical protein [Xanthomonas arboricola]|uniref:hypothetical protein n=1 Tax=Xanthomonas arboricola TaxID=56448 RepID=UPI001F49BBA1|nr:hypothetical protein [Xanthomonas arboricola]
MSSVDEVAAERSADIVGEAITLTDPSFPSLSAALAHYAQVTEQKTAPAQSSAGAWLLA